MLFNSVDGREVVITTDDDLHCFSFSDIADKFSSIGSYSQGVKANFEEFLTNTPSKSRKITSACLVY